MYSIRTFLLALLFLAVIARDSQADTWAPPTVRVHASPDGSALLRIEPGAEESRALAIVFKYNPTSGDYKKAGQFRLRNALAPMGALISNNAQFVVTFDDAAEMGRTENVVVVYRGTGEYLKSWRLSQIFTEDEIKRFVSSVSSTWWRGDVWMLESSAQTPLAFINPEVRQASVLRVAGEELPKKVFSLLILDLSTLTFQKR